LAALLIYCWCSRCCFLLLLLLLLQGLLMLSAATSSKGQVAAVAGQGSQCSSMLAQTSSRGEAGRTAIEQIVSPFQHHIEQAAVEAAAVCCVKNQHQYMLPGRKLRQQLENHLMTCAAAAAAFPMLAG
jgi:hypothetical protein